MASRKLTQLADLPENLVGSGNEPTAEEARQEHKARLADVDLEAIDKIILSNDLQLGGKIRLERKGPLDQVYQYICTIPAEQWKSEETLEHIKKMYGGGDYQARTFRANGQMYKPFTFSVDYRMKGKLDDDEIRRLSDRASNGDTGNARLLEVLQKTSDGGFKMADALKMMEMSQGKSDQMMTLVMTMMIKSQESMSHIMASMMAAMASNRQPTVDPMVLELLKQRSEVSTRTPMMEVIETMKALKELSGEPKTEEPEETDMISRITKLLGSAGPIIGAMTGRPVPAEPIPQPVNHQLPNGAPVQQPAQQPATILDALPPMAKMGMSQLVRAAERNSDPTIYCDLIIDNIGGDEELALLRNILTRDDWCAKIWGDEARVAHVRPWLEELRQQILTYDTDRTADPDRSDAGPVSDPVVPVGSGANPTLP